MLLVLFTPWEVQPPSAGKVTPLAGQEKKCPAWWGRQKQELSKVDKHTGIRRHQLELFVQQTSQDDWRS